MTISSHEPPDNLGLNRDARGVQKQTDDEQRVKAARAGSAVFDDRLDIPSHSKEVADIMASVERLPEIREARVRDIKRRIDMGIYIIDPWKVAESILKSI